MPLCTLRRLLLQRGSNLAKPFSMLPPAGIARNKVHPRSRARLWMDLPLRRPPLLPSLPKVVIPCRTTRKRTLSSPPSVLRRDHVARLVTNGINSSDSTCLDHNLLDLRNSPNCSSLDLESIFRSRFLDTCNWFSAIYKYEVTVPLQTYAVAFHLKSAESISRPRISLLYGNKTSLSFTWCLYGVSTTLFILPRGPSSKRRR